MPFNLFRMIRRAEIETRSPGVVGADIVKHLRLPAPDVVFGDGRSREVSLWGAVHEDHDTVRFGEREWLQQDCVYYRENGGVGADPESQSRNRRGGETRALAKHPEGLFEVGCKCFHGRVLARLRLARSRIILDAETRRRY